MSSGDVADRRPQAANGPIPSLDGIRAVSVALVFFSHNGLGNLVPGSLGVTIFFVLSGFLITTLMRAEFAKQGTVSFRAFYLRRFLRLTPPLLIITVISVVLSLWLQVGEPFNSTGLASVLFYFSNYYVIGTDFHGQPPGLGVTWSLAVEEHYYFLYPPLALLLFRLRRPMVAGVVIAALCGVVLAWRCWLASHGANERYLSMATDTRLDAILFGCLLAFVRNPWLDPVSKTRPVRDLSLFAGLLVLMVGTLLFRDEFFRNTFRYSAQCLIIAGFLYLAVARAELAPFRWLNAKPVVYVGAISYSFYLAHVMVLLWAEKYHETLGQFGVALVTLVVTVAIAALMRKYVENPLARLRHRLHAAAPPRQALEAAVSRSS